MKLSIVIPVLNSHEVVRRQLLHFERVGVSDDTELILVDDGSDPPLDAEFYAPFLRIISTGDTRPWTWALARNRGAKEAGGDMLLMTDVDHILSRELLDSVRGCKQPKMQFKREFGILRDDGSFTQSESELMEYGLPAARLKKHGVKLSPLTNNFAMQRDVFWEIGGYREDLVERPYPQGEDRLFRGAWQQWQDAGNGRVDTYRPTVYMFPNGYYCGDVDHNPFGLFHTHTRKTRRNTLHTREV